jgi:hypothetical protein
MRVIVNIDLHKVDKGAHIDNFEFARVPYVKRVILCLECRRQHLITTNFPVADPPWLERRE